MLEQILLTATDRVANSNPKVLRNSGLVPAIMYYGQEPAVSITLNEKAVTKYFYEGRLNLSIVKIQHNDKEILALVRQVQLDPVTDKIIHLDLQKVFSGQQVKVPVKIRVINTDTCPGIKKGGSLNIAKSKIECYCDPDHYVRSLAIDLSKFEMGTTIRINDLKLPRNLQVIEQGNFTVLSIAGSSGEETAAKPE